MTDAQKNSLASFPMVVHFKHLAAHKKSVLELYRTLVRHATHMAESKEVVEGIRAHFKRQRPQMSLNIVRQSLEKGYELEQRLREMLQSDSVNIGEVKELLALPKNVKAKRLVNRFGQPMKRDLNNQQDLQTQQIQNYVNQYVRRKQRTGELPRVIDPMILESIIKPEALHYRAQLDLERAQEKISTGPYKVHITRSASIKFLRGPWLQHPGISPMILRYVRKEQELTDYRHYYEENEWLYHAENLWCGHAGEPQDWGLSIENDLRTYTRNLNTRREFFKQFAEKILPSKLQRQQVRSDAIHKRKKSRLALVMKEAEGVTPFEDMLGKSTLRELVKKL